MAILFSLSLLSTLYSQSPKFITKLFLLKKFASKIQHPSWKFSILWMLLPSGFSNTILKELFQEKGGGRNAPKQIYETEPQGIWPFSKCSIIYAKYGGIYFYNLLRCNGYDASAN